VTRITCQRCGRSVTVIVPCTTVIIESCPERCVVSLTGQGAPAGEDSLKIIQRAFAYLTRSGL